MEYVTAKSYEGGERLKKYEKNGKMYALMRFKCDRCVNGVFICRVENEKLIPHPAYGGVCLKCNGTGFEDKEVRLYTPEERVKMDEKAEKERLKKEEAIKLEMEASFEKNKLEWLSQHKFNENGDTYIITGDSYSIKDELKAAGFYYDPILRWHRDTPTGYKDRVIKLNKDEILSFSAWGKGMYKENAADLVKGLIERDLPPSVSEYQGKIGEKITFIGEIVSKRSFEGRFGLTNVITFKDAADNIYTWFTSTHIETPIGVQATIAATVKSHEKYKGIKTTYITRAKIKEI